ncbi:MAG: tetratricopeptide repeat protein [Pseudomonadota bacterium]
MPCQPGSVSGAAGSEDRAKGFIDRGQWAIKEVAPWQSRYSADFLRMESIVEAPGRRNLHTVTHGTRMNAHWMSIVYRDRSMIETNGETVEAAFVAKGREFLQRGDVSAAVECYEQAYDPDSLDETEARSMLIEARSHFSRKHLSEALESFEEALVMGTDVQRRQALDGIFSIGEIQSRLPFLTQKLKKGLEELTDKKPLEAIGLALISDAENVVLIADESVEKLAGRMAVGKKMTKLPQHIEDLQLPIEAGQCFPYADDDDVDFIIQAAAELADESIPEEDGS